MYVIINRRVSMFFDSLGWVTEILNYPCGS